MALHCLGKPGDAEPRGTDSRLFVEAVLWIVRTGSPWRDWPEEFGKCNTVFKRFRDWVFGPGSNGALDLSVADFLATEAARICQQQKARPGKDCHRACNKKG